MQAIGKNVCRSIMGSVGNNLYFGKNEYGPFQTSRKWQKGTHGNPDWDCVFFTRELSAIWQDMTVEAKASWKKLSEKLKITDFMAYMKVNMNRLIKGRESIQFFTGEM